MTNHSTQPRRPAFILLQMIILLPLMAFLMGCVLWGLLAQMAVSRRIAEQSDRQAAMRSVLTRMRADLREADGVGFEALDGRRFISPLHLPSELRAGARRLAAMLHEPPSRWRAALAVNSPVWVLRLNRGEQSVRYLLHDLRPPPDDTGGGREWSFPQMLRREDAAGEVMEWRLAGQTMACRPAAFAPSRAVVVRFESRLADRAAIESYHVFETTLLTGGGHGSAR